MWQQHLIIVGVLLLMALPLYLLDHFLLRPSGDIFLINLRSMLIVAYAAWLAVHVPLSTLALYLLKTDRLYTLHALAALASAALLVGGLKLNDRIQAAEAREKREARMKMREGLFDSITLEKWWYTPGAATPEAIGAVLVVGHSGRLAARVEGRSSAKDGTTVYAGEMKPQKEVRAGERIEYTFSLRHYGGAQAEHVRFRFSLFRDRHGSAPEDIFKIYGAVPEQADDGRYFYAVLPPPVAP
jgi:hypothetical protein